MDGIDKKFEEVNRLFDGRESVKMGEGKRLSLDIVSGLTDILKKINQKSERNGEILFSFLNELAADKKFVPQIDRIFRSGGGVYPLVSELSNFPETKKKFNELFKKLPEWYQNKLLGETIS